MNNRIRTEMGGTYTCVLVQHPEGHFELYQRRADLDARGSIKFRPEWPRGNPEESRAQEMIALGMLEMDKYYRETGKIPKRADVESSREGNFTVLFRTN